MDVIFIMEEPKSNKIIFNKEYITSKVNQLTAHESYWCLYYLNQINPVEKVFLVKDDRNCKKKLITVLEIRNFSPTRVDNLLAEMSAIIIPQSHISWLHGKDRATLWFIMALRSSDYRIKYITTREEIMTANHDIIYSKNIYYLSRKIINPKDYQLEYTVHKKIAVLNTLRDMFILSKIRDNELEWLDRKDRKQIDWAYEYMLNKRSKDNTLNTYLGASDYIYFDIDETASRYNHILASFDYMGFIFLNSTTISSPVPLNHYAFETRTKFIRTMKNTWQKQKSRLKTLKDIDSNTKLNKPTTKTSKIAYINKHTLKKQSFKAISTVYNKKNNNWLIYYKKPHISQFETEQTLQVQNNTPEHLLVDCEGNDIINVNVQVKALDLPPDIEDSVCTDNAEPIVNAQQNQSDDKTVSLDNVDDTATENSIGEEINRHEVMIATTNISTMKGNDLLTKLQATESNLASDENLHNIDDKIADGDPFSINAKLIKQKVGRA